MKTVFLFLIAAITSLSLHACVSESGVDSCEQGATKCDGNALLTCSSGGNWRKVLDCNGSRPVCDLNDGCVGCLKNNDCKDATKPVCNQKTKACQAADAVCGQGEKRCDGKMLSTCNDAQSGFDEIVCGGETPICDATNGCIECFNNTDCKDEAKPVCNTTIHVCQAANAVCDQGEKKCDRNAFLTCNADQSGFDATVCTATTPKCDPIKGCVACRNNYDCGDLNTPVCNTTTNVCQAANAVCNKDEAKCEGNTFLTCNSDQSGFDETVCPTTTPFCDASKGCVTCRNSDDCKDSAKPVCNANMKVCQAADAMCSEGETQCRNGSVFVCASVGQWESGRNCIKGCNDQGTACIRCDKGETGCSGNTFKTCNANQSDFDETSCTLEELNCDHVKGCVECVTNDDCEDIRSVCDTTTNTCHAAACKPGETKCEKDMLYTCDSTGNWPNLGSPCTEGPKVCNTQATACAICSKDDAYCTTGNTLIRCNATQTDKETIRCTTGAPYCSTSQGGRCVECLKSEDCKEVAKPVCDTATLVCVK